jgi:hypothetical protein
VGVVVIHLVAALPRVRVVRAAVVGDHRLAGVATVRLAARLLAAAGGLRPAHPAHHRDMGRLPVHPQRLPVTARLQVLPAAATVRPGLLPAAATARPGRLPAVAMVRPGLPPAAAMVRPGLPPAAVCRPDTCRPGCHPAERLVMDRPVVHRLAVYRPVVHHPVAATARPEAADTARRVPSHHPAAVSGRPDMARPEALVRLVAPLPAGAVRPAATVRPACPRPRAVRPAPGRRWRQ